MDNLSPFDILGIEKTDDKYIISGAYRRMILLVHPDKVKSSGLNWTTAQCNEAFNKIRGAYKTIIKSYNFVDMPDYDLKYSEENMEAITKESFKNIKDFNTRFEKHKLKEEKEGYLDPYQTNGYSEFGRTIKNTNDLKNKLSKEYKVSKKLETRRQKQLIRHKPEIMNSGSSNIFEFGLSNVDDFGFSSIGKSSNSLMGADLSQVHNNDENWESSIQRNKKDYEKYNNTGSLQNDVERIKSERELFDSVPIKYEKAKLDDFEKIKKRNLIQKRRDDYYYNKSLNN